jgi:hypothetical protein
MKTIKTTNTPLAPVAPVAIRRPSPIRTLTPDVRRMRRCLRVALAAAILTVTPALTVAASAADDGGNDYTQAGVGRFESTRPIGNLPAVTQGVWYAPITVNPPKLCPAFSGQFVAWKPIVQIYLPDKLWHDLNIGAGWSSWQRSNVDAYGECLGVPSGAWTSPTADIALPNRGNYYLRVGYVSAWYWSPTKTAYARFINRVADLYSIGPRLSSGDAWFTYQLR